MNELDGDLKNGKSDTLNQRYNTLHSLTNKLWPLCQKPGLMLQVVFDQVHKAKGRVEAFSKYLAR